MMIWLAAVLVGPALAQMGGPVVVTVDAVRLESVQQHRRVTGELRAVRRSSVATREAGLVIEVPVREGMRVKAGDMLARLDSGILLLELKRAEADRAAAAGIVDERKANLSWREQELVLYRQSAERGASNVKELLDAESVATIARTRVLQAERLAGVADARLELLKKRLADMTVLAPFDGVVLARLAELGEWVGEGDPLVELVSVGQVEAWIDIPQRYFAAVAKRQVVITISIDSIQERADADRLRIIPQVDRRSRSFTVVVRLDDHDGRLTPGMSLSAWVPTGGRSDELTLSSDAVLRNDIGAYVYVARGGGLGTPGNATPANVQVRFPVDDRIVVESAALQPGDLIVVEGNERLFPGAPVIPQQRVAADKPGREPR
ncbi:MAG: efflux RND transporter periplasmic adaptor subunit [Phycisphaerales bacterium]